MNTFEIIFIVYIFGALISGVYFLFIYDRIAIHLSKEGHDFKSVIATILLSVLLWFVFWGLFVIKYLKKVIKWMKN